MNIASTSLFAENERSTGAILKKNALLQRFRQRRVALWRFKKHRSVGPFFRISILSLGLKNKCCMFRVAILFHTRRCMRTTLKTRRFRSSSELQTIGPERGRRERRECGRRCIRECIVPSFSSQSKINFRPPHALYIFFPLSHFLSARAAALVYGA